MAEPQFLGIEVALSMLGNVCEILVAITDEINRPDLGKKVMDTLDMAATVLEHSIGGSDG
jgi:hypothetical protein